ncbi:MAG: hypothetical protein FD155_3266 [Bacteroidetes bacterium]|nr:MAG: hypothetical protein FD155_3266 [Bacteroidota bacterium]
MNQKIISWAIIVALVLTWGSSFILIKRGLEHFSAVEVGALRVVITFLSLLPFALLALKKIQKKDLLWLGISGIVGSLIPAFLFAIAQTGIDSATAGLLNSLTPLFTLIIGYFLFGLAAGKRNVLGVFVGLIGAIGLIYVSGGNNFSFNLKYSSLIVLATVFYAINVNLIKAKLKHISSLNITSLTFFIAGIIASFILFGATDVVSQLKTDPGALKGLFFISILAVVGTAAAMIAFNYLIKISSPIFASSVTYLIPLIAMAWGFTDGEYFSLWHAVWTLMIIGGVILVNSKRRLQVKPGKAL